MAGYPREFGGGEGAGSVEEVFGDLADLPVAVILGSFESGVDLGTFEGREGDDHARRRTAGLSVVAASTAGSPAGSPIDPSAATAASRTSASA